MAVGTRAADVPTNRRPECWGTFIAVEYTHRQQNSVGHWGSRNMECIATRLSVVEGTHQEEGVWETRNKENNNNNATEHHTASCTT